VSINNIFYDAAVLWYSSLINEGVPFIIDVLGFILNTPNYRLFSTVGLTAPLYGPPTLFPLES
jgi:hypothetical protein